MQRTVPFAGLKLVQTLLEIGYGDPQEFVRAESLVMPWVDEFLMQSAEAVATLVSSPTTVGRS